MLRSWMAAPTVRTGSLLEAEGPAIDASTVASSSLKLSSSLLSTIATKLTPTMPILAYKQVEYLLSADELAIGLLQDRRLL